MLTRAASVSNPASPCTVCGILTIIAAMIEVRNTVIDESEVDTLVSEDMEFRGSIRTQGSLMIQGRVDGTVESEAEIYIEEAGWIHGSIIGATVIVKGTVSGPIRASAVIELLRGCSVEGDLEAPSVMIEDGAFHRGACKDSPESSAEADDGSCVEAL